MKRLLLNIISHALNVLTPVRVIVILAVAFFFWFLAFGDQGIYQLKRLLEMKNQLTARKILLNDDIDRLVREKEILSNPDNLEMVIRKELGYIRPGEVIFEEKGHDSKRAE